MSELAAFDVTPEPRWKPSDTQEQCDFCNDRDTNQRKRNLETLLWLGMEIDGSLAQGAAKRNRPLKYCRCNGGGRK